MSEVCVLCSFLLVLFFISYAVIYRASFQNTHHHLRSMQTKPCAACPIPVCLTCFIESPSSGVQSKQVIASQAKEVYEQGKGTCSMACHLMMQYNNDILVQLRLIKLRDLHGDQRTLLHSLITQNPLQNKD